MKFLKIKDWPTNLKGVVVVGGIFILSRLLLAGLGVSFNLEYLEKGWQFIDPALLKNQLWSSLWYLHSQPPLFNLFSGLVLQLFPVHFSLVFHWFFVMAGLALTVFLFLIMRKLKINWWLAVVITLLFVLSPTIILFENFFFYDYLVLVILLISVFFLQQYLEKNKSGYLFTFFLILSLLTLLRSLFHLVWFLVIFLVLLYFYRRNWKKVILASLIPFLLIIGWYGKNLYLFGNFGASSWMGMGLYKTTMFLTTEAERQTLFKEGITSGYFPMDPFTINLANIKIQKVMVI
ncbi:MAG: hypothetical protein NTV81_02110 [Candidatus Komeilibacteria bacterium]|nr:hypothetical protein [Candidatus Komeilibacteria bacterium]